MGALCEKQRLPYVRKAAQLLGQPGPSFSRLRSRVFRHLSENPTNIFRWSWVVIGLAFATGVANSQESELDRGAKLLKPFKRELQQTLVKGLAQGPAEAIAACQLQAPKVAKALEKDGIRVGRTSHRLRNPANISPDWVQPILDAYLASPSERTPRAVPLPNSHTGYVEPILLKPPCLVCHGDVLTADVASRISETYPKDQAVGFQTGDLRGVFWIEYPATESPH